MIDSEGPRLSNIRAAVYRIPTDAPEADGTFAWDSTTLVVVHVQGGSETGMGYTYADGAAAGLVSGLLADSIKDKTSFDLPGAWAAMWRAVRNVGRSGLAACAISAVDAALWDLKARLLDQPLASLLGRCRNRVAVYGSGGFTSYSDGQLKRQLSDWVHEDGCQAVKMKVGSEPARDPQRIAAARAAIGSAELFIDANGALSARESLSLAQRCADSDIRWLEEPVTSDDVEGHRLVRESVSPRIDVAAGEYNYNLDDARRLLECGAVDVLQADATRCGGITGFLQIGTLCEAHHIDLSGHCAPSLHCHVACAIPRVRHVEWFHDHARIERMLFEGAPAVRDGFMSPDPGRPGHGLAIRTQDAQAFQI